MIPTLLLLSTVLSTAVTVDISLEDRQGSATPTDRGILVATPVLKRESSALGEVRKEIAIPGTQSLDLSAAEAWRIEIHAPGLWSPPHLFSRTSSEDQLRIKLISTTEIRGSFHLETSASRPASAEMRFKYYDTTSRKSGVTAVHPCTIDFPSWSCDVPRGLLDLRLKAEGFVPHYFWDVDVDRPMDFGKAILERGNSLFGRVETADSSPLGDDCEVVLTPLAGYMPESKTKDRLKLKATSSVVNPRGYFQLTGVEEGAHTLIIRKPGWSPLERSPVILKADVDLELSETLVLSRPIAMTIAVRPALDSNGGKWVVHLARLSDEEPVASEPVDAGGIWKKAGLAAMDYRLRLSDSMGNSVYHDVLSLRPDSNEFSIQLETVLVEGTVTLGEIPLAAELRFGGRHGAVSVPMESDEQGQFSGILPRDGYWKVDIVSEDPRIFRRLPRIDVEPAADGVASVNIELPDTLIQGEVVYEDNRSARDAKIILVPLEIAERVASVNTDESGFFEVRGQAPGQYKIEAHGRDSKRSASNVITGGVKKSNPWTGIRLILRESVTLRGRVVSAHSGQPVPGALVLPESVPGQADQAVIMPQGRTDQNGSFLFELPRGLRKVDLNVLALGFLLEKTNVDIDEHNNEVLIPLSQEGGGSLRLQLNTPNQGLERALEGERFPVVYSDQMISYSLNFLGLWARMHGTPFRGQELVIPQMQPGIYYTCWISSFEVASTTFDIGRAGADCEGRILSPGDEISFKEPAKERDTVN